MNLSEHFTLEEATFSGTAARLGIGNTPLSDILLNMIKAAEYLEQLRTYINQRINITSWYRSELLNSNITGSSRTSAHISGFAIDCRTEKLTVLELCKVTKEFLDHTNIPYDQIIHEYGSWMHISFDPRNRQECLTIFKNNQGKKYLSGLLSEKEYNLT